MASTGENPFGKPQVFVEGDFADFQGRTYSVHPDGKRVLLKVLPFERTSREIRIHTDLVADLRRLEDESAVRAR